ncbi:MAG: SpaH/EbpB family LPXTG-anchored major pilin [Clostridia bacterium]|nr:SpaH/EbpB family LPXTG-anchored major pilin [Clostridia bacterium]
MKTMKKLFSVLLVVVMLTAIFAVSTNAAGEGSITINGVSTENTYEIYKLLDLESYDTVSGAYSYKVNSEWTGFFDSAEALAYVTIDDAGYVTWTNGEDDASVAAFAKAALAYAKANGISPVKSSKNPVEFVITTTGGITSGKFSGLDLGYYLVDSTMGALCGLTTTNPAASINAKNGSPTIDKQVQEDSTEQWVDQNTADIGQIVNYRVTINVHAGAENYVLHDKMSAGLTFQGVSSIELVVPSGGGSTTTTVNTSAYTVNTTGLGDDCTFEVVFAKDFCDTLETNYKVIVHYSAMLNRNAIVAGEGNLNNATLEYGEDHFTTEDSVKTYTFGFDLVKTDSQNTLIDGAEFKIYDAATGGNEVAVVLMDDNVTYRRARADETGVSIVVKNGQVRVVGFDNGTYYLEETVAPQGYNKLTARQKFIISDGNLDAIYNAGIFSTGSGVHVVNKTGSMLPETGALGTTIFVALGGIVVLGAGVLLFVRKRMSQIEE